MKKFYLLAILACLSIPARGQQILSLETGSAVKGIVSEMPVRTVEQDDKGVTVTYYIDKVGKKTDPIYPKSTIWTIPGFAIGGEEGKPMSVTREDLIHIPHNMTATVSLLESNFKEYSSTVAPSRPPLSEDSFDGYTVDNVKPVKSFKGYYPDSTVESGELYTYRGENMLSVTVNPMRYSMDSGKVRIYTTIKYRVEFHTVPNATQSKPLNYVGIGNSLIDNIVVNPRHKEKAISEDVTLGYVIITVPEFIEAANRFAEWKRVTGYRTYVISQTNWTPTKIKSKVRAAYENDPRLFAVAIIGDHAHVPAENLDTYRAHISDFNYGCVTEGKHIMPDLLRGRISVSNAQEASDVIGKIIYYEQSLSNNSNFYKNALHCAYFQDSDPKDTYADRRFAQTSEEILEFMRQNDMRINRVYSTPSYVTPLYWNNDFYSNGEAIPDSMRKPNFKWNGTAKDITEAINKGVCYVLHRDHGSQVSWGSPSYGISDIESLRNGYKLPIVFSINCQTGMMSESKVCFAEKFIRHNKGGCSGIIAATNSSYSGNNDEFAIEMFNAMYPDSPMTPRFGNFSTVVNDSVKRTETFLLGQVMDNGLGLVGNRFQWNDNVTTYTRELFHCFGDPTMDIYMGVPKPFRNVDIIRSSSIKVTLAQEETARISFYDRETGDVKCYLGNNATFLCSTPENVTISVTGHDRIPFIDYGSNEVAYIQNETISGIRSYSSRAIKVGKHVTDSKERGDVVFSEGVFSLKANSVELCAGTVVSKGAELSIETQ